MKTLAERGWSAARIVSYYYPGTSVEHVASIGQRGR
jgi:peptidoglycan hydrolase-like amidase